MNLNLTRLFELQKELDERIVREKQLEGQDLLPNKILALQVELGELANEWRGFKHWSSDREPRREKMLEEYVDCLHFILSIGLEFGKQPNLYDEVFENGSDVSMTRAFSILIQFDWYEDRDDYDAFLYTFIYFGEMLGFTWSEIESAYLAKNAVNHKRQETNY